MKMDNPLIIFMCKVDGYSPPLLLQHPLLPCPLMIKDRNSFYPLKVQSSLMIGLSSYYFGFIG
jgi:hypothetical protein